MAGYIDTHCHIHAADEDLNRQDLTSQKWHNANEKSSANLLNSAFESGVNKLICVGVDYEDSSAAVDFAKLHSGAYASVGVHPHEAQSFFDEYDNLDVFSKLVKDQKVVAIGEVGLDYYYQHSPRKKQALLLERFLDLASGHDLPVIFHVREAFDDFWPILNNFSNIRGVLHSYTSTEKNLVIAVEKNLYIGLNGIMTFSGDQSQLEMAKKIPLNRLVLETDAPYLTPKPLRGKICKPEYVKYTYDFVAKLKNQEINQFKQKIAENVKKLYTI